MVAANWQTRLQGGRDISSIAPVAGGFLLLGLASLLGLRAALYALVAVFGGVGIWLAYGTVKEVPFPWMLFNIPVGLVLALPAIILLRLQLRRIRATRSESTPGPSKVSDPRSRN
jgi:hypothetical protein